MKVVLAGAFGHLGLDVLRELVRQGHEVVALGRSIRKPEDLQEGYTAVQADVQKPAQLRGVCDGADVVISTVGLTKASAELSCYDVDYQGNRYLLNEAKRAGVKNFAYVSVLKADGDPSVPMLDAKAMFEAELKKSGLNWVIFRPTGYFYDIAKVFMPMVEKGKVTLLGNRDVRANVVDTPDFAAFIVEHMCDSGKTYNVGGKETWTYEELANMFFAAAGKAPVISRAPVWLFDALAWVNKKKKNGKEAIIRFSKWTLTEEMVGDTVVGDASFAEYIKSCYAEAECSSLNSCALQLAQKHFEMTERNIGDFSRLKGKGMHFYTRVYDAKGAGSLFLMDMAAPLGVMNMQTAVFSPTELDGPILSLDFVEVGEKCTLVMELYDATFSHPGFQPLSEVGKRFPQIPEYNPGAHWFDTIQLPVSEHRKGKKLRNEMLQMAQEYIALYYELLLQCSPCDAAEKKAKNGEFANGLLQNGGPAVDQFRKMVGDEKTAAFIKSCMFSCE